MKKRLLSALLALALVFVLLPTTALAGVTRGSDYDISINGTNYVFSDSETCYFKSSFTSTEPSSPYLKLTKSSDTITVTVSGYVTVSDISVHNNFSTQDKINLIITGNKGSTLNIECKDTYGAALETYQSGDITIKGGITVNANFSANNTNRNTNCHGISASKNLIITGKGTTVNAVNADHDAAAVKVGGNITVSDGAQLNATNKYYGSNSSNNTDKAYAIKCGQLSISGNNTKVTAYTSNGKKAISGTVNNGDKLTFKAANYKGSQIFLQRPMDEALGYAYVEITQAPTNPYVRIAGEPAIIGQETPIPGGTGTYRYDVGTGYNGDTLTLKDATINKTDSSIKAVQAIRFGENGYYTINLVGTNTISGFSSGIVAPNDSGVNNVTVVLSGSGSLDITANQYAIDMQVGKLKFENTGTIKLTTGYNYYVNPLNALRVKTGNISIDNTKYDIVGARQEKNYPTETISDSSAFTPDLLNGYTVGEETTLFKTITITPAAAKPSTIRYNGTTLKQGETITGENGGTATVDSKNNTITLDNFKGNYPLEFNAEFTPNSITLIGDSTLSAVETKYQNLTISGSGSLTVGSIRVPNNTQNTANLTITGGAHVTVNRPSGEDEPAVEVSGNLTVTGDGTQLSAECTAATNPAIEVGGNVTISGNPGTNAYTVKAYNKYATPRGRDDKLRPSQMPSAIEISGDSLSISNSAQVMAKTDSDGAAVWMPKQKVISVVDASLIAQNRSHNFSTISFGDESNMGNIYAKGQVNIVAENMLGSNSRLAHRAIKAYIYNHYSTGDSNPYYIKVVSEGVQSGGNVNVIPGDCTSTGGYKVTITRGDAYVAPTKTITEIIVTGLTPPVKGATPVDKSKVTLTDGLTVESITWGPALTSDGKFAANTAYTAHINYSVKAGYELAANANCPQVAGANVTRWHQEGMPQDEIEVTFPKTAADTPTEKPTITLDLPAPVAGVAPVTTGVTATSSDNTPLTIDKVEWYAYTVEYNNGKFERIVEGDKVSGNFEANTYYFAEITFDRSIYFANEGLNIIAPTWPLEGSWPESRIYRVIENSYTARILFPATDAACNHQPGDWQDGTDGEHHVKVCAICHNVVATESHAFGGYQINTNNSHTRVCSVCNAAYTNAHEFNSYAHNENSHWKVCVCGATTSYANHEFDPATGACACGATQSGGNPTPDVPAAPTGLAGVAPTSANSKDGKITGTTAAMEYATEPNGSNWIECGGDEVTGLSAGTYYVRYKRTTDKPASAVATVVVPAYSGGGEIVPPTPDNPGTIVIIRPAEEEKPAQQPNPSTGANDLVGMAVAAAVVAVLGSVALLRKHD